MKRIIIIGGGISGLAAAHRLLERSRTFPQPLEIRVFEANSRLGGIIQTDSREGFLLERGPDSFISEKPEVIQLAQRLGIEARLTPTNSAYRRSFIVRKGRLQPVPEGFHLLAPGKWWPFLSSGIFSVAGKARMAAELILPRKRLNGDADESLAQFVRRRFGNEALTRMAQPMAGGIYTADPEKLSMRATFPRFLDMEAQYRSIILALLKAGSQEKSSTSGARYSLFLSFEGGMQSLIDSLAEKLSQFNFQRSHSLESSVTDINLNSTVESLERLGDNNPTWRVEIKNGPTVTADAVCLAVSAPVAGKLLSKISPRLTSELLRIPHASTATVNLAFRREDITHPLNGFGFVVPYAERRSLLACTFSSIKFAGRAPEGCALLRAFVGGALQPEMFALEEEEMISRVCTDLRELVGVHKPPLFAEVSKWPSSMPQYEIGHLGRIQEFNREVQHLTNLRIAGNAYNGPGIPDCIRSGESAADQLIDALSAAI